MGNFKFGRTNLKSDRMLIRNVPSVDFTNIVHFEPARTNRFIVETIGTLIPVHQIFRYDFNIVNNVFTFDLSFYDLVNFTFNPNNINDISGFIVNYLDPTGVVYNSVHLEVVNCLEYHKYGDYSSDEITTNHAKFTVRVV